MREWNDGWDTYRALCKLGDYEAALAEAKRVAPDPVAHIGPVSRDSYLANMVWNHIEQEQRNREKTD